MILSARIVAGSALALTSLAAIVLACGSSDDSTFPEGPLQGGSFSDGALGGGEGSTGPDPYAKDPLPLWCGPGEQPDAGAVTGPEECPSDKNKPGCECDHVNDTAPCWTGLRKHRNLGICKDGTTKCIAKNETLNVWGPCEGEVLPTPNATGKDGCGCFSVGVWNITNLSPCTRFDNGNYWSYSTVYAGGKSTYCNPDAGPIAPPNTAPPGIWSPNKVQADCAGTFTLCFKIRAGDYNNPKSTDCVLGQVCTDPVTYTTTNEFQNLPDLKTWAGGDAACAQKWDTTDPNVSPGYGEMIVKGGKSVHCDEIGSPDGDFVFNRVLYCPTKCRNGQNPDDPVCKACQLSGQGSFH